MLFFNIFRLTRPLLPGILIFGAGFACAPKSNDHDESFRSDALNGSLSQNFKAIQSSTNAEACDQKSKDVINEIVTTLDAKADEIAKHPATVITHDKTKGDVLVPFAGGNLVKIPFSPSDTPGWTESKLSWGMIISIYRKNKNSDQANFWSFLNSRVHAILSYDQKRVLDQLNLYIDKDSVAALPPIQNIVQTCFKDQSCTSLTWPDNLAPLVNQNRLYHQLQTLLDAATGSAKKRDLISQFQHRVNLDSTFRLNDLNHTVLRSESSDGKQVLQLPLDGSIFSDIDRATLKGFIEDVWKTAQNQVEIVWKNSSEDADLFKIFFDQGVGSMSYTEFYQHQVHLFPYNNNRVIAHEIGHVMGLDDHYYILWNPDTCEYTVQTNNDDLMSNQNTGSVTADEWSQLLEKYPASSLR